MTEKHYLFCPGPVMISDQVRDALLHPDMCHLVPMFESVFRNIQRNLLAVYKANDDYTILLITGSGTAANETVISSYFTPEDEVLLINNGVFGERIEELLQIHEVKTTVLQYDWGQYPNINEIELKLKTSPKITTIIMVFHETSTGVVNPISQVGELAHRYAKTYIVDGVSAVGGEDVDVVRDHIDFCTSSSNKCLASLPGVGIICAKKTKLNESKGNRTRVVYLNLLKLYKMSETLHQTPNTPSTTMFIALDAAVKGLLSEGIDRQINRYRRCAQIIRSGVKKLGLNLLVNEKIASNTVTSVLLPKNIDLQAFISALEYKGYTVYPGKGHLKDQNMFQISNMGAIDEAICHKFLNILDETLREFRHTSKTEENI